MPLTGTVVTSGGYLTVNMTTVNFGGVFIGGQQPSTASRAITLFNRGSTTLVFKGFAWQDYYADMSYHNVTSDVVGNGYTATNFPALGSSLTPGASIIIPMVFLPAKVGIAATYLTFWSDGGYTTTQMQGNAQQGVVVSSSSSSAAPTTSSSIVKPSSSTAVTSSSTPVTSTSTPVTSTSQPISSSTTVPSTTSSSAAPSSTGVRPQVGNYAFKGCWTESTTGRALSSKTYANDSMTLESCAAFCSASPAFSMFGVEYGRECEYHSLCFEPQLTFQATVETHWELAVSRQMTQRPVASCAPVTRLHTVEEARDCNFMLLVPLLRPLARQV